MQTTSLIISWVYDTADPSGVTYYINSVEVGRNETGFDNILSKISEGTYEDIVIRIDEMRSLGGESLEDTLPFKHRFDEFRRVLQGKKITYELF